MSITPTPDASILDRYGHVVVVHAEPRHREYIATKDPDDGHTLAEHHGTVALGTLYLDPATGVAYRLTNYYSDGYGADKRPDVPHYSMLNVDGTQSRGTLPDTAVPVWSPVGPRGEHRHTHTTYSTDTNPHDAFVSHCICGFTTRGMDPDDADAKMIDHTNPEPGR